MALRVVGVRHHSPACARLVADTIAKVRPRYVLIEGPADMNGRMEELYLSHQLPIAVFSFHTAAGQTQASWSPFCAHSPEWIALEKAREVGAEARFIDLPAWAPAFRDIQNRYSDRHERRSRIVQTLCRRFGVSDMDALWDHMFEQPMPVATLSERLETYFAETRASEPGDERDGPREAFMARAIAWAMTQGGDVVVVCGGYHKPELERLAPRVEPTWAEMPAVEDGARVGSYLVPYSFHRLDSFTGYESGMPSPAYQAAVFAASAEEAAETFLVRTVERLRQKKQPVSPADVIAIGSMAEGLRRLRGHVSISRSDLLDGLAAGLVKDSLDVPLPWTYRGTILPRTDPMLVEMVAAFSGDAVGRLAPGTPQPPLLEDVRAQLDLHDLLPAKASRDVTLELAQTRDVDRSRVLHRLRVLHIPGFQRVGGPSFATEGPLTERWRLAEVLEAPGALIEAAAYGATLETAAAARIEEALLGAAGQIHVLAFLLGEAIFVGVHSLAQRILANVRRGVGQEPSFAALGEALGRLLGLWKHDTLLGSAGAPALATVIEAAFDRGLWLLEGIQGGAAPADPQQIRAVVALRDTLVHGENRLAASKAEAHAVWQRRSSDAEAPPALRGASLGGLWSTGFFGEAPLAEAEAVMAVRRSARPEMLGDFLVGLFALAREQVLHARSLVETLDLVFGEMEQSGFLIALPSLRLAFSYFPPKEKELLARSVVALRGGEDHEAHGLLRLEADPSEIAAGMALDVEVAKLAERFGLQDEA